VRRKKKRNKYAKESNEIRKDEMWSCKRKRQFSSKESALDLSRGLIRPRAYSCPYCKKWHVTAAKGKR